MRENSKINRLGIRQFFSLSTSFGQLKASKIAEKKLEKDIGMQNIEKGKKTEHK
jgi:hypothetical protein